MDALLTLRNMEDIKISNEIKYLSVADTKIYKVTDIDFKNLTIEAHEMVLSIADVPGNEVFLIEELGEFRIRLCNGDEKMSGDVIDFGEWIRTHSM